MVDGDNSAHGLASELASNHTIRVCTGTVCLVVGATNDVVQSSIFDHNPTRRDVEVVT